MALTNIQNDEIKTALDQAGASLPCPRCGNQHVELLDGYLIEFVQTQLRNMVVGSNNRYTSAATICTRCGFISQHALSVLGLLPEEQESTKGSS